jgi:competence protein ComGB
LGILKNLNMSAWCMIMKRHNWSIYEQAKFLKQIGELLARGYPIAAANEITDTK